MRTLGVVTTSRADYGIYRTVLRHIEADPDLRLWLYVTGMHLSASCGTTVEAIERDGYEIVERIETLSASDAPEAVASAMGRGVMGFAEALTRSRPDILVVLGDRFDMFPAALAALPLKIPVAHIHGGEVTSGAIDDSLRHAMTKLSHLHFVATKEYARRVVQLGEEPWRVIVSGAPGLDNLATLERLSKDELEKRFGFSLDPAPLLVTFHPVTLDHEHTTQHIEQLLTALDAAGHPVVFTLPNADTGGRMIADAIAQYVARHDDAWQADNMGAQGYFSLMEHALAMVGNSSSGLIEAPSFGLPVVNIGDRQSGRIRGNNVIDTICASDKIIDAIHTATTLEFRRSLTKKINPYGDGHAAERVLERLKTVSLNRDLIRKCFHDLLAAPHPQGADDA